MKFYPIACTLACLAISAVADAAPQSTQTGKGSPLVFEPKASFDDPNPWQRLSSEQQDVDAFERFFNGSKLIDCRTVRLPVDECVAVQAFVVATAGRLWRARNFQLERRALTLKRPVASSLIKKWPSYGSRQQSLFFGNEAASFAICLESLCGYVIRFSHYDGKYWAREWRAATRFYRCTTETRERIILEEARFVGPMAAYAETILGQTSQPRGKISIMESCPTDMLSDNVRRFSLWRVPTSIFGNIKF